MLFLSHTLSLSSHSFFSPQVVYDLGIAPQAMYYKSGIFFETLIRTARSSKILATGGRYEK